MTGTPHPTPPLWTSAQRARLVRLCAAVVATWALGGASRRAVLASVGLSVLLAIGLDAALPVGFGDLPYRPDQVMHLEANVDRLRAATGWLPAMPIEQGLRATVDWYRTHDV